MINNIITLLEEFDYDKNTMEDVKELMKFIIQDLKNIQDYQEDIIIHLLKTIRKD